MDMGRNILIVDDNDVYRDQLKDDLIKAGYTAEGVATGEEGVDLVEENPQLFQFAVIDQILMDKTGCMGGIEAANRISDINRKLFILVFTNLWFEEEEKARYEYEALSAGAHRYIQRESEEEEKKSIVNFVNEIKELSELSARIAGYHEEMASVPSLLTQLDIGMDIVDRSHKVWYMSEAFRRITGYKEKDLPKRPCSFWHGYRFFPCFGCPVECVVADSQNHNDIFLAQLPFREKGRLFYLYIWTQPLKRRDANLLLGHDGKPLAVMESFRDLTGSKDIKEMPLEQRLGIIAHSLQSCPVENKYLPTRQFRHVKIFCHIGSVKDDFALMATAGYKTKFVLGKYVNLKPDELYAGAEERMRKQQTGSWYEEAGRKDPLDISVSAERSVLWPVMEAGQTVAWIEAGGRDCSQDSVSKIKPFAAEVLSAIRDGRKRDPVVLSDSTELELARIQSRVQTASTAKEALGLLVRAACEHTDSHFAIVRYVQGEQAVVLPLGLEALSAYEDVAEASYPLSHGASWSVRTINSRQIQCTSDAEVIRAYQMELSEEAQGILKGVKSACYEPLFYNDVCIGSLGLHSQYASSYSGNKVALVTEVCPFVAAVLHDYLVERRLEERFQKMAQEGLEGVTVGTERGERLDETGEMGLEGEGAESEISTGPPKVFLSYKREDKGLAEGYRKVLNGLGFEVWYDSEELRASDIVLRRISGAMKECCAAVFLITPRFKDEGYIATEIEYAMRQKTIRGRFKIIPLVFKEGDKVGKVPDLFDSADFVLKGPFASNMDAVAELIRCLHDELSGLHSKEQIRVAIERIVSKLMRGISEGDFGYGKERE